MVLIGRMVRPLFLAWLISSRNTDNPWCFFGGYRTEAYYFPEGGFAVAVQINTTDRASLGGPPVRILDEVAARVAAHLEADR